MNTSIGNTIILHKKDSSTRSFELSDTGLYFSNVDAYSGTVLTITTTIKDQKTKYSALDVWRATISRQLQATIGDPTTKDFLDIIEKSILDDCGTIRKYILVAEDIIGPSGSRLKGKTTTPSTTHVRKDIIPAPGKILDNYQDVCLEVHHLFVNAIAFLTTVSQHLYLTTVKAIINDEAKPLLK